MEYIKLIAGFGILLYSGKYLVKGSVSIAQYFKISTLVVGVTVVSFGTSAPELVVSLKAALSGHPDIAIGNVVGSNISNIALVLGIIAIILPIPVKKQTRITDWPVMMFSCILFYIFVLDQSLSFYEGLIFVTLLILFIYKIVTKSRKDYISDNTGDHVKQNLFIAILFIVASSVGLIFGSDLLIDGAKQIASNFGISERVISVSVIAFGTSVPELATSIVAAVKKEMDISVGNIIGSNIFNIFGILGITSIFKNIFVNPLILSFDIFWVIGTSLLLLLFIIPYKGKSRLNTLSGIVFLLSYTLYIYLVVK